MTGEWWSLFSLSFLPNFASAFLSANKLLLTIEEWKNVNKKQFFFSHISPSLLGVLWRSVAGECKCKARRFIFLLAINARSYEQFMNLLAEKEEKLKMPSSENKSWKLTHHLAVILWDYFSPFSFSNESTNSLRFCQCDCIDFTSFAWSSASSSSRFIFLLDQAPFESNFPSSSTTDMSNLYPRWIIIENSLVYANYEHNQY